MYELKKLPEHETKNTENKRVFQNSVPSKKYTFSPETGQMQPIQRKLEPYKVGEISEINEFLVELDDIVQKSAAMALSPFDLPDTEDGHIKRWKITANELLTTQKYPDFLYAHYGYAIESLTTKYMPHIEGGYTVNTQVTHGNTRPDIVISDSNRIEVAWIDITSAESVKHIFDKDGSGWKHKLYVYEVTYPKLDPLAITANSMQKPEIFEKIQSMKEAIEKREEEQKLIYENFYKFIDDKLAENKWDKSLEDLFSRDIIHRKGEFKKDLKLESVLCPEISHKAIRSLLEIYFRNHWQKNNWEKIDEANPNDENAISSFGDFLRHFGYSRREQIGRNKSEAENYIFLTFNKNPSDEEEELIVIENEEEKELTAAEEKEKERRIAAEKEYVKKFFAEKFEFKI